MVVTAPPDNNNNYFEISSSERHPTNVSKIYLFDSLGDF